MFCFHKKCSAPFMSAHSILGFQINLCAFLGSKFIFFYFFHIFLEKLFFFLKFCFSFFCQDVLDTDITLYTYHAVRTNSPSDETLHVLEVSLPLFHHSPYMIKISFDTIDTISIYRTLSFFEIFLWYWIRFLISAYLCWSCLGWPRVELGVWGRGSKY